MITEGLYALLAADSGVSAIVGARIYYVEAPPDLTKYPCVAYRLVGGNSNPTFNTSGTLRSRVEIDAYAINGSVADELRGAVINAVNGWQQKLGDNTNVLDAILLNPGTDFCSEERIFRCMCEFYVLYTLPS